MNLKQGYAYATGTFLPLQGFSLWRGPIAFKIGSDWTTTFASDTAWPQEVLAFSLYKKKSCQLCLLGSKYRTKESFRENLITKKRWGKRRRDWI